MSHLFRTFRYPGGGHFRRVSQTGTLPGLS
jgi:hypothetical protein